MGNCIAVFKSRRDAMDFSNRLFRNGVRNLVVSTPSSIDSNCGLSIKFSANALNIAKRVLTSGEFFSFKGFYNI